MKKEIIKKLDKAVIEYYKNLEPKCAVCGGQYSELHHWYAKRRNLFLRWAPQNIVPLCTTCHAKAETDARHWKTYFIDYFYNDLLFLREGKNYIIKDGFDYEKLLNYYKNKIDINKIRSWYIDQIIFWQLGTGRRKYSD